jgi:hypothetical protein
MAQAKVNYTVEQTDSMKAEYVAAQAAGTPNAKIVAKLAGNLGKATRSVISKLSKEGVYIAEAKVKKTPVDTGPSKVALVEDLEAVLAKINSGEAVVLESLMNLNKADIQSLTAIVSQAVGLVTETDEA